MPVGRLLLRDPDLSVVHGYPGHPSHSLGEVHIHFINLLSHTHYMLGLKLLQFILLFFSRIKVGK